MLRVCHFFKLFLVGNGGVREFHLLLTGHSKVTIYDILGGGFRSAFKSGFAKGMTFVQLLEQGSVGSDASVLSV